MRVSVGVQNVCACWGRGGGGGGGGVKRGGLLSKNKCFCYFQNDQTRTIDEIKVKYDNSFIFNIAYTF